MSQLIKGKTRDTGIFDLCFANKPKLFDKPKQLPKIDNSDHYTVIVKPAINAKSKLTASKPVLHRREMKDSNSREFGQWITSKTWNDVFELEECGEKYDLFQKTLTNAIDDFFPQKRCKTSRKDKPWVTSNLKTFISQRQVAFSKYGQFSGEFKHLRNKVQYNIKMCKSAYYHNRVKQRVKMMERDQTLGRGQRYHRMVPSIIMRHNTHSTTAHWEGQRFRRGSGLGFPASAPSGQY